MSISQGNIATAADINAIIAAIKTEQSRRGIGQETMNKLSGDFERAADPTTLKSDLAAINSKHTTTLSVTHTNSGTSKTLLTDSVTFGAGGLVTSTAAAALNTDITNLTAQCSCNSNSAAMCNNCPVCSNCCNTKCCNGQCCNGQCCNCDRGNM